MPPADPSGVGHIVGDLLNGLIALGWALLIVTGLEADRPMSGGIPGHVDTLGSTVPPPREGLSGRVGTAAGWALFAAVSVSLPFVLWWVSTIRPR